MRHSVTFLDGLHTLGFSTLFFFSPFPTPSPSSVSSLPQTTPEMQFHFHTFRAGGYNSQLLCTFLQSLVRPRQGNFFLIMIGTPPLYCQGHWVLDRPLDNVETQPTSPLAGKTRKDMQRKEDWPIGLGTLISSELWVRRLGVAGRQRTRFQSQPFL